MDSPLSRSPGSRVFMGVGLPITRVSSPFGGPHRLEYWGTPPHSRSPPLDLPPPPPLLHWPIEWDCVAPIRFWLVPGFACQLLPFAPSDWPCAKKRFTSSSPANSARMVVFPRTHLKDGKRDNNSYKGATNDDERRWTDALIEMSLNLDKNGKFLHNTFYYLLFRTGAATLICDTFMVYIYDMTS